MASRVEKVENLLFANGQPLAAKPVRLLCDVFYTQWSVHDDSNGRFKPSA